MELSNLIKEYIKPELLILAVVLFFIGKGIKNSKLIANKYIPLVLGFIGIILSAIYVIANDTFLNGYKSILMAIFTSIVQGILIASLSVYINENISQIKKEE